MANLSLYRKYRPQTFSEMVGQNHIRDTLMAAVRTNRVAHAYLFCGTRGTGKTTTARILAKAVNCTKTKTGEPCNKCDSCRDFLSGRSLDLIEIDAASNRGIDEIREIVEKIKFAPAKAAYKIFVIDEAHMLTREAFNALLKTLEEPPPHAIFVLATTEAHKLPATILSRVQRFDFKRVGPKDIEKRLNTIAKKEKITLTKEAMAVICEAADGSFRDAESLLDQVVSSVGKRVRLADLEMILGVSDQTSAAKMIDLLALGDTKGGIKLINDLLRDGHDLAFFAKNLVEYLRKLLLIKTAGISAGELFSEPVQPQKQADELSAKTILNFLRSIIGAQREIKNSAIPQLPLEMAIVDQTIDFKQTTAIEASEAMNETKNSDRVSPVKAVSQNVSTSMDKITAAIKQAPGKITDKISQITNLNQLIDFWPRLLSAAGKVNNSILTLLRSSVPVDIKNDKIILAVHFKFLQDQMLAERRYRALLSLVREVTGKDYQLECVLAETVDEKVINKIKSKIAKLDRKGEEELMDSVAEVFGA